MRLQDSPEATVSASDITRITENPSVQRDVQLRVTVMRSTTFLLIDGQHFSIDRDEWDKIRALSPPDD